MRQIRIITDNSIQYGQKNINNLDIHVSLPYQISILNSNPQPIANPFLRDFPKSLTPGYSIKIVPPSMDDFLLLFNSDNLEFFDFLVLSSSSCLPSIYNTAIQTMESLRGQSSIHVLDTMTIHAGLLFLLQEAALLVKKNASLFSIEAHIRDLIPHIYTLLCIPNLSYLSSLGIIDPAQAIVGEMLELLPVFSMEEGHLTVLDKFQKPRQVVDYYINYISEFSDLNKVLLIHNYRMFLPDKNKLSDFIKTKYPHTSISLLPPSIPLTAMLGPEVFGMIAIEYP